MSDRDTTPKPDTPAETNRRQRYDSTDQSIALARETMRDIRAALTTGADGTFPPRYADVDWAGMNMQPPKTSWQDMDMEQRYDLLLHVLDESIWSLEPAAKWNEPSDSQKLANEFVKDEERQLHAEMRHDYGLRLLEDRGVKYEDEPKRDLDAARDTGRKQDRPLTPTSIKEPAMSPVASAPQTRNPWPSEIAEANRHKQPAPDHDRSNGHETGHSM